MPLPDTLCRRLVLLGVRPGEVEERFIRGSGPGGQKINKTSSTIWLRHAPTGIEVRCQRERSQLQNRIAAWEELASRIEERRRAALASARQEREASRRRRRQKSPGQKARMVEEKRRRAANKGGRGRVDWE